MTEQKDKLTVPKSFGGVDGQQALEKILEGPAPQAPLSEDDPNYMRQLARTDPEKFKKKYQEYLNTPGHKKYAALLKQMIDSGVKFTVDGGDFILS